MQEVSVGEELEDQLPPEDVVRGFLEHDLGVRSQSADLGDDARREVTTETVELLVRQQLAQPDRARPEGMIALVNPTPVKMVHVDEYVRLGAGRDSRMLRQQELQPGGAAAWTAPDEEELATGWRTRRRVEASDHVLIRIEHRAPLPPLPR